MTKQRSSNAINRGQWGCLTPYCRNYLRAKYKHLRKCEVRRIIARGSVNRTGDMLNLAKAGI